MMNNNTIAKANKIVEMINAKGIKAEIQRKNTNGIELIGICMGDGNVRPTFYPEFDKITDYDREVDELIETYNKHKDTDGMFTDIINSFDDFDFVKGSIIPCLMAAAADDVVSRDYLDLKVIYKYILDGGQASITVEKSHLDKWDVTEDTLFNIAKENIKPTFINMTMMQMLSEMSGLPMDAMSPDMVDDPMKVFTTKSRSWGASVLLFPELFASMGNKITILPSSIHEVIALANDHGIDNDGFINMITEVNQTQLKPEEVLSNHPYIYSDGVIKEAD